MIVEVGDIFITYVNSDIHLFTIIESKLSEEKFRTSSIAVDFRNIKLIESQEILNIDYIQESYSHFNSYNKLSLFERLFRGNS